jgi:hypothetical protein
MNPSREPPAKLSFNITGTRYPRCNSIRVYSALRAEPSKKKRLRKIKLNRYGGPPGARGNKKIFVPMDRPPYDESNTATDTESSLGRRKLSIGSRSDRSHGFTKCSRDSDQCACCRQRHVPVAATLVRTPVDSLPLCSSNSHRAETEGVVSAVLSVQKALIRPAGSRFAGWRVQTCAAHVATVAVRTSARGNAWALRLGHVMQSYALSTPHLAEHLHPLPYVFPTKVSAVHLSTGVSQAKVYFSPC